MVGFTTHSRAIIEHGFLGSHIPATTFSASGKITDAQGAEKSSPSMLLEAFINLLNQKQVSIGLVSAEKINFVSLYDNSLAAHCCENVGKEIEEYRNRKLMPEVVF